VQNFTATDAGVPRRSNEEPTARDRRLVTATLWLPAEHSTANSVWSKTGVFLVVAALKGIALPQPGYTAANMSINRFELNCSIEPTSALRVPAQL